MMTRRPCRPLRHRNARSERTPGKRGPLRWFTVLLTVVLVAGVIVVVSGAAFFNAYAQSRPLTPSDAVVVLGGEHDGREDYGVQLVRAGLARDVVLSDPYPEGDRIMRRICSAVAPDVPVTCFRPSPSTTRGEALFTRDLAQSRGWRRVIVVTWQFHLARARLIFEQCLTGTPVEVTVHAVPRRYDYSPLMWAKVYGYQYAATAKAILQGACP